MSIALVFYRFAKSECVYLLLINGRTKSMKRFVSSDSAKKLLFGAMCLALLCMLFCIIYLGSRLEAAESKRKNLDRLLEICQEQLDEYKTAVTLQAGTIAQLHDTIFAKDMELTNMTAGGNSDLFAEQFSGIEFRDGLDYVEIWELNKQYSLVTNAVNLNSIGRQVELNETLISLVSECLEAETDDSKRVVLQALLDGFEDNYRQILPIYQFLLKENKELADYDTTIPKPIG